MKKLLIIIALLIVVALVAPKFVGGVVETEYQSALDKAAENPALVINSTTFTRSWFNGEMTSQVTILLHDDTLPDINLTVTDHISFGPVIFTNNGVEFALSYSQVEMDLHDIIPDEEIADFINNSIHLTGLLTFSKDVVSTITIDEFSKEEEGNTIVSAKAVGEFVLENDKRLYGEFNWDGLTVTSSEETFTIGKTRFNLDQTLIAGDYYQGNAISTGDFNFTIAAINSKDATGNEILSLKELALGAIASVDEELMTITINYGAGEIKSKGQVFNNANLTMVIDNLDIKVMQEVNTLLTSLSGEPEQMFNEQNMQAISPLLTKLLARDPVLNITDLSVDTPEGKIQSDMEIAIDKDAFDASNLMTIVPAVKADAKGNAPMPFFAKLGLAPMIDMYVEQGLLIKQEQELSFKASFSQGQLNINGNAIPL